jgi:hypothetical protein
MVSPWFNRLHLQATVDVEDGAGDVARFVVDAESNGPGDLRRLTEAADGDPADDELQGLLGTADTMSVSMKPGAIVDDARRHRRDRPEAHGRVNAVSPGASETLSAAAIAIA